MTEAEVVVVFRVIDRLEDRTMFLLMLRCRLRVSEVSNLLWAATDMAQGTLRVNTSKGQGDRVGLSVPRCRHRSAPVARAPGGGESLGVSEPYDTEGGLRSGPDKSATA